MSLVLEKGESAFVQALFKQHLEVVKYLVQQGISIEMVNNIGLNSLIVTSDLGDLELVKLVLPLTDDIDAQNKYGETALMRAAMKGHTAVIAHLLGNGADKSLKDSFDNDALFYTHKFDQPEARQLLMGD